MFNIIRKYKFLFLAMAIGVCIAYYFCLPRKLFNAPTSTVINGSNGELLGALIAGDGQWRFPVIDTIPEKFKQCILYFEDEYFYKHPGFNPVSLLRASYQNIRAGKIISGGSTITMQVIRLSRQGKSRSFLEKFKEIVLATRLELRMTKDEILALYASHAPFGGNMVGLPAAGWRYFGRGSYDLSWAEAATLAVLPNQPALIFPGRNQTLLIAKRNRLLKKLLSNKVIDSLTYSLAIEEPVPGKPFRLPNEVPHLLTRALKDDRKGEVINSSIEVDKQKKVKQILANHHDRLSQNNIQNAAALVLRVRDAKALVYQGNIIASQKNDHGTDVDIITAKRSTGSVLKPFLYAAMLQEGELLPKTLLPDIPTFIQGFAPKNFSREYEGAVHADAALARSLNVPAVHMLRDHGTEKFHFLLKEQYGMKSLEHSPGHYGLSLILGGAEGSLWELSGMYATMARVLNNYFRHPEPYRYSSNDFLVPDYINSQQSTEISRKGNDKTSPLSAAAIWHTFNAMLEVYRPDTESSWKLFDSSRKIAWKTGTSFGFRDAWAIGVTPEYVVGVWVGNADGEGRPGLTGISAAAPVMFDIFDLFPNTSWFNRPNSELESMTICRESGQRASKICPSVDTLRILKSGIRSGLCTFHKLIHLDKHETYRVHSDCESVNNMAHKTWFVLPPVQEYYFKSKSATYKVLPPYRDDCREQIEQQHSMQIIYPKEQAQIFVPRELDGSMGRTIFEVAHRIPETEIHWHIDNTFLGSTKRIHQMGLHPDEGEHTLTLVDEKGEILKLNFEIIGN
ncbi:penicillin-binding protein 1C [Fulvivirgaceae bacterium BMA10]|uniref:peptidoglycan glycosyltransferase n=1 Tax=Splendidivirga corallicola TaxID=3051826 RepID=A0ABT8KSW0_9BACT|nr:penicillin-binding protein 1C [Fulvivirgaceae bacterium BMA10]